MIWVSFVVFMLLFTIGCGVLDAKIGGRERSKRREVS